MEGVLHEPPETWSGQQRLSNDQQSGWGEVLPAVSQLTSSRDEGQTITTTTTTTTTTGTYRASYLLSSQAPLRIPIKY